MSDLKPCPFCGKEPNQMTAELGDRPCFYYECENPKCQAAEMGWHDTEQEAIDAWNTRPIEDALRKEIAQLQADNRSLVEQMNQMALKQNQEVIEWHKRSEELLEMPSGNTSIKPMVGVYRIATVSSLKKIESISLSYDSEKERLRQIYLRANSCNNNVNSDTNN